MPAKTSPIGSPAVSWALQGRRSVRQSPPVWQPPKCGAKAAAPLQAPSTESEGLPSPWPRLQTATGASGPGKAREPRPRTMFLASPWSRLGAELCEPFGVQKAARAERQHLRGSDGTSRRGADQPTPVAFLLPANPPNEVSAASRQPRGQHHIPARRRTPPGGVPGEPPPCRGPGGTRQTNSAPIPARSLRELGGTGR